MTNPTPMPRFLTADQVADQLGITRHMVQAERERGTLPHHKVGRLIRFTQGDVDTYVERTAATPATHLVRTRMSRTRRKAS